MRSGAAPQAQGSSEAVFKEEMELLNQHHRFGTLTHSSGGSTMVRGVVGPGGVAAGAMAAERAGQMSQGDTDSIRHRQQR